MTGKNILVKVNSIHFLEEFFSLELDNNTTLKVPYKDWKRLKNATMEQRKNVEISRMGLHWEDVDEDLSFKGLMRLYGKK